MDVSLCHTWLTEFSCLCYLELKGLFVDPTGLEIQKHIFCDSGDIFFDYKSRFFSTYIPFAREGIGQRNGEHGLADVESERGQRGEVFTLFIDLSNPESLSLLFVQRTIQTSQWPGGTSSRMSGLMTHKEQVYRP